MHKDLLIENKEVLEAKLFTTWMDTPIGEMVIVASHEYLYLIEFMTRKNLDKEIEYLKSNMDFMIIEGCTEITKMIEDEMEQYFAGTLTEFKTPMKFIGTSFQKSVWEELCKIPYGETISYLTLAKRVGNPNGFRAVANANGRNQLAIIVPCHRVINSNGKLGGYGGGLDKKVWLLQHESDEITLF